MVVGWHHWIISIQFVVREKGNKTAAALEKRRREDFMIYGHTRLRTSELKDLEEDDEWSQISVSFPPLARHSSKRISGHLSTFESGE